VPGLPAARTVTNIDPAGAAPGVLPGYTRSAGPSGSDRCAKYGPRATSGGAGRIRTIEVLRGARPCVPRTAEGRALRLLTRTLLLLGLAAGLAAPAALTAATPAAAAVPDRWGFAYVENPTPPPVWTPTDPAHQATSTGAGNAEVRSLGLGRYHVRFPGTAAPGGVAHVTAVHDAGRWCQLVTWWGDAAGFQNAVVYCFRPGGVLDASRFTIVYTRASGTAPLVQGVHAYAVSDGAGAFVDQFHSLGAANSVSHGGPGVWKVFVPTPGPAGPSGNVQVTAVGGAGGVRCKVGGWGGGPNDQTVQVRCFSAAGFPADTRWTLSYHRNRSVLGRPVGPLPWLTHRFAYHAVNGLPPGPTSFNSLGGTNTDVPAGLGLYYVRFPLVGLLPDHVQVTAQGPGPEYCGLNTVWNTFGGDAHVRNVICFNALGVRDKSDSLVTFAARS
jgi:hypothetical protein